MPIALSLEKLWGGRCPLQSTLKPRINPNLERVKKKLRGTSRCTDIADVLEWTSRAVSASSPTKSLGRAVVKSALHFYLSLLMIPMKRKIAQGGYLAGRTGIIPKSTVGKSESTSISSLEGPHWPFSLIPHFNFLISSSPVNVAWEFKACPWLALCAKCLGQLWEPFQCNS